MELVPPPSLVLTPRRHTMIRPVATHWARRGRDAALFLCLATFALLAFAFYTGEPGFFLKWFFGLQSDT